MKPGRFILTMALALLAPVGTAQAQHVPAPVGHVAADDFEHLYDTLEQGIDREAMLDGMTASMRTQYAAMPAIAAAERQRPGLLDELMTALRPVLGDYSERVRLAYRPEMIELLRSGLTTAEARELAELYASPLGRIAMGKAAASYRPDNVLATIGRDGEVSAATVDADMKSMAAEALAKLEPAQLQMLVAKVTAMPAFKSLAAIMPRMHAIRAKMEHEPTTSDENAAMERAIADLSERYSRE